MDDVGTEGLPLMVAAEVRAYISHALGEKPLPPHPQLKVYAALGLN